MLDQQRTKLRNRSIVLDLIRTRPGVSQSEISARTALQPSTVSYAVRDLRGRGLVLSGGRTESSPNGGKPRTTLEADGAAGRFLTFAVRAGRVDHGLFDFACRPLSREVESSLTTAHNIERYIETVARSAANGGPPLRGVGIAVASIVTQDGVVLPSAAFPHRFSQLGGRVQSAVGAVPPVPIVIENDANCAAATIADAETTVLAFVVSSDPATVGAGLAVNGTIYRGAHNAAGELYAEGSEPEPDPSAGVVSTVIRFADPDAVVFVRDETSTAVSTYEAVIAREKESGRAVHLERYPDALLTGAARLAYEHALPDILGFERSGGRT